MPRGTSIGSRGISGNNGRNLIQQSNAWIHEDEIPPDPPSDLPCSSASRPQPANTIDDGKRKRVRLSSSNSESESLTRRLRSSCTDREPSDLRSGLRRVFKVPNDSGTSVASTRNKTRTTNRESSLTTSSRDTSETVSRDSSMTRSRTQSVATSPRRLVPENQEFVEDEEDSTSDSDSEEDDVSDNDMEDSSDEELDEHDKRPAINEKRKLRKELIGKSRKSIYLSFEQLQDFIGFVAAEAERSKTLNIHAVARNFIKFSKKKYGKHQTCTEEGYRNKLKRYFKEKTHLLDGINQHNIAAILYKTQWPVPEELANKLRENGHLELRNGRLLYYNLNEGVSQVEFPIPTDNYDMERESDDDDDDDLDDEEEDDDIGGNKIPRRRFRKNRTSRTVMSVKKKKKLLIFLAERAEEFLSKAAHKKKYFSLLPALKSYQDQTREANVTKNPTTSLWEKVYRMLVLSPDNTDFVEYEKIATILYATQWPVCDEFRSEFNKIARFDLDEDGRIIYYESHDPNGLNTRKTRLTHRNSIRVDEKSFGNEGIDADEDSEDMEDKKEEEDLDKEERQTRGSTRNRRSNQHRPPSRDVRSHYQDDDEEVDLDLQPETRIGTRNSNRHTSSGVTRSRSVRQIEEYTNTRVFLLAILNSITSMKMAILEGTHAKLTNSIDRCPLEAKIKIKNVGIVVTYIATSVEEELTETVDKTISLTKLYVVLKQVINTVASSKLKDVDDYLRHWATENAHLGDRIPNETFKSAIENLVKKLLDKTTT